MSVGSEWLTVPLESSRPYDAPRLRHRLLKDRCLNPATYVALSVFLVFVSFCFTHSESGLVSASMFRVFVSSGWAALFIMGNELILNPW